MNALPMQRLALSVALAMLGLCAGCDRHRCFGESCPPSFAGEAQPSVAPPQFPKEVRLLKLVVSPDNSRLVIFMDYQGRTVEQHYRMGPVVPTPGLE